MLSTLMARWRAHRLRVEAAEELRRSPHICRDLGIEPDQIDAYVRGRLSR